MLINKFGPLGTDLDRMTLKFCPREPVIKKFKMADYLKPGNFENLYYLHVT